MKVSIVTITHNRAHLIADTIQSVLDQRYANFEHIIIDDGSTDDTQRVIGAFKDPRIIYRRFDRIANLSKLHNLGIRQATGELIAVLDSDDIWVGDKLEKIVGVFNANAKVDFLTHNIRYFSVRDGLGKPYYRYTDDFFKQATDDVLRFGLLPFPVHVFKKQITNEIGMLNESLVDGQQDFLMRVACRYKIYFLADCLTHMRIHDSNIHKTNNLPYFINYYKSILRLWTTNAINFFQFSRGMFQNSKSLAKHILKMQS